MSDLLKRAKAEGTPLIDGDQVTFLWQGDDPPKLIADFSDWDWGASGPIILNEVKPPSGDPIALPESGSRIWTHTLTLPPDAYIEYAYITDDGRIRDPYNSRLITNGMGKMNHYFTMPEAQHTRLVKRRRGIPKGKVTYHKVEGGFAVVFSPRATWLYQPPTDDPVPLLIVLDGGDYVHRAKLPVIVDNLIAAGEMAPIAMAMPHHGGRARFVEYMCSDATIAFLARDVIPYAARHLNLIDIESSPGSYGILGASMGGLMALYSGMRLPDVFGTVISQSGAFGFDMRGHEAIIYEVIRNGERRPLNIWMDVGRYEWLLTANRRMRALLVSQGYDPHYREYNGGHNYTIWRDEVVLALKAMFPKKA